MNTKVDDLVYRILIIVPLIILFSVTVFPFLFVVFISFFDVRSYNLTTHWEFVGLQNYFKVIADRENITAVINTALYIFYALGLEIL